MSMLDLLLWSGIVTGAEGAVAAGMAAAFAAQHMAPFGGN